MSLTTLDIIILICFIPALLHGFKKGFAEELLTIALLFLGTFLSCRFAQKATSALTHVFPEASLTVLKILSFVLIFAAVGAALWIVGRIIRKLLDITSLSLLNRLVGVAFSVFLTCIILSIVFTALVNFNLKANIIKPEVFDSSALYQGIQNFSDKVMPFLREFFTFKNV